MGFGVETVDGVWGVGIAGAGGGDDVAAHGGAGGVAGEEDAVWVDSEFLGSGFEEADGAVAVEGSRVVVVLGFEAIGEDEGGGAPIVEALGEFDAFYTIHEHDVGAARGDDDSGAVALFFGWEEGSEEGGVEGCGADGEGDFSSRPKGDVEVGFFCGQGRREQGGEEE